jgi:HD superfamily phosphohydrolase
MYSQVYFHDVRRAYDIHLRDFLKAWLPTRYGNAAFSTDWEEHLRLSDGHVQVALQEAAFTDGHALQELARRLVCRRHYRTVYTLVAQHKQANPNILNDMSEALVREFGEDAVRVHQYTPKSEVNDFRVVTKDGTLTTSHAVSDVIKNVPPFDIGYVFVDAGVASQAERKARTFLNSALGTMGGT